MKTLKAPVNKELSKLRAVKEKEFRDSLSDEKIVAEGLAYGHRHFIQGFRDQFPHMPEIWLQDQAKVFKWVAKTDARKCFEKVAIPAVKALGLLMDSDNIDSYEDICDICYILFPVRLSGENLTPWQFEELWPFIKKYDKDGNRTDLLNSLSQHSQTMSLCGLLSVYLPAITRTLVHMHRHNTKDQFNVRYSDIINGDTRNATLVEESLENLIKSAVNVRGRPDTDDQELKQKQELNSIVGEALIDAFPIDPIDGIQAAGNGDAKIKYVPKRASDRYIRTSIKENRYSYPLISANTLIQPDSGLTILDSLEDRANNFVNVLETVDTLNKENEIANLLEEITPRQLQAYSMRKSSIDGKRPTFQQIGDELDISKERAIQLYYMAEKKIKDYLDKK